MTTTDEALAEVQERFDRLVSHLKRVREHDKVEEVIAHVIAALSSVGEEL